MGEHDLSSVCCMCGDVGFPAKLFLCTKCCERYQHSYCSNYYNELGTVCDWCQSEERGGNRMICWTKLDKKDGGNLSRQENSTGKKNKDVLDGHDKAKNAGATSSSRPANRRYKLLKDVMC
ncbi:unnamed protein product [Victoria cruziana]